MPSLVRWSEASDELPALVCIPWAGAGAAPFRSWSRALEGHSVIYAARFRGRESRLTERPQASVVAMIDELTDVLLSLPHARVALFGHCSGAVIAFELARRLGTQTSRIAHLLVASQLPPRRVAEADPRELKAEEIVIRREVESTFAPEPELRDLILDAVVADMQAIVAYRYEPGVPLNVPITIFVGSNDEHIRLPDVEGWKDETLARIRVREIEGANHLFRGEAWHSLARASRSALDDDAS
jgi:surfactin synthase thioesterase subunit